MLEICKRVWVNPFLETCPALNPPSFNSFKNSNSKILCLVGGLALGTALVIDGLARTISHYDIYVGRPLKDKNLATDTGVIRIIYGSTLIVTIAWATFNNMLSDSLIKAD